MFSIRAQLITFDLLALVQNCNIIQLDGYDERRDCDIYDEAIERQAFCRYLKCLSTSEIDHDCWKFSA